MDIADWRKKIDELDQRLVEMLNERATAAKAIGSLKRNTKMPIYEPDREREIFENVRHIEVLAGVQEVHRISSPYKLVGRSFRPEGIVIKLSNGLSLGGNDIVVMAGPCSVESREQIFTAAEVVSKAGAKVLRGGAFK